MENKVKDAIFTIFTSILLMVASIIIVKVANHEDINPYNYKNIVDYIDGKEIKPLKNKGI